MEVLRIIVYPQQAAEVAGGDEKIVFLPFTGRCDGPLFCGEILPGGVDTQHVHPDGNVSISARYVMSGKDAKGQPCRIFIENTADMRPGRETVTHPVIRTDSEYLRWLETAALTGSIEGHADHLEIVIRSEDEPQVEHLTITRAGLKLRGRLEKRCAGPCPLVLMLHGFTADMGARDGEWFQHLSDGLTAAGFATLRFDFNGHGQSEGRFCDMTVPNELEDAAAFLQYALHREDVTSVSVLGHSQGGVVAGLLAGCYPDAVRSLALLAPAASLKTDAQQGRCMAAAYDPQHVPETVDIGGGHHVGGLYFRLARMLPIYEVAAQFAGRAMAVLPGRDAVVSHEGIARYAQVMPDCRLVEKATLDHGLFGKEHAETLQEIVRFFLDAGASS